MYLQILSDSIFKRVAQCFLFTIVRNILQERFKHLFKHISKKKESERKNLLDVRKQMYFLLVFSCSLNIFLKCQCHVQITNKLN